MDAGRCCVEARQAPDAPVVVPLSQCARAIDVAAALLKIVKSV